MTTPPPYDHQFSVPPNPHAASGITADMLPPIPPRPRELTAGLWGTALGMLVCLTGAVWDTTVKLGTVRPGPDGAEELAAALDPVVHSIIISVAAGVLCHFMRQGSKTGLILGIVGAALAVLQFAIAAGWTAIAAIPGGPSAVDNPFMRDPYSIALTVTGAIAVPVLLAFSRPACVRWSGKAGAIRMVRSLLERGRPVRRLPPALHD